MCNRFLRLTCCMSIPPSAITYQLTCLLSVSIWVFCFALRAEALSYTGDDSTKEPATEKSVLNADIHSESQWQQQTSDGSGQTQGNLDHFLKHSKN